MEDLEGSSSIRMEQTSDTHFESLRERKNQKIEPVQTDDPIPRGEINNVKIDEEMAATARIQIYYSMMVKEMNNKFKQLHWSVTGRNS
ncbi:MAG: hypothetical protein P8Y60_17155 [Calditrichota bacterium]